MREHDAKSDVTPARRPLVVSIHGIRTRGAWQKRLVRYLGDAGYDAEPLDYGYFGALALLLGFRRRQKIDWFRDQYHEVTRGRQCHIIAHSFGTYIVARALEIYPELRCERLILCGSIIRRDYPWGTIKARGQVARVLNDFGRLDVWSRIGEWLVRDAGQSGLRGFDHPDASVLVQREHPEFRHSDYFYAANFKQNWIAFLDGNEPPADLLPAPPQWNWRYTFTVTLLLLLIVIGAIVLLTRNSSKTDTTTSVTAVATGTQSTAGANGTDGTGIGSDLTSGTSGTSTGGGVAPVPEPPPPEPAAASSLLTPAGCICSGNVNNGQCVCRTPGSFTWARPSAIGAVSIVACGGGGGGGQAGGAGHDGRDNAGGGGGGEGAPIYELSLTGLVDASYALIVGGGGRGGAGSSAVPGADGVASSFGSEHATPFVVTPNATSPRTIPDASILRFPGGAGGKGGAHGFQGGAGGAGGQGNDGAKGGDGHGPANDQTHRSMDGARSRFELGGLGTTNCQTVGWSGGSGGGGGGAYGRGGAGGCGGGSGGAEAGRPGGPCAGGGGGGGFGQDQRPGQPGGDGGNGYVLIRWGPV